MKVVDVRPLRIKVNHRGDWILVLVETDEGIIGLGEASQSGDDDLMLATLKVMREKLIGYDPLNIEVILRDLKTRQLMRSRFWQIALSGAEQALWDIMGQYLKVPIHTLLGGALRKKIRLYANINRCMVNRTPEGYAEIAKKAASDGFTAIKIAPFEELVDYDHIRTGSKAAWRKGVERIRKVREAIGDDVELAVDCHGRMDATEAIFVSELIEDCNLLWFEEPVPRQYLEELKRVSTGVSMPVAGGEYLYGVEGFRSLLTSHVVDIIMPDVKWDGGLLETKLIAGAARMNQIHVSPHSPAGPVASAAGAHVSSTLTNFFILEHAWGEVDWRAELLDPPEKIENGHLILSDRPGLGHRLNEEVLKQHLDT